MMSSPSRRRCFWWKLEHLFPFTHPRFPRFSCVLLFVAAGDNDTNNNNNNTSISRLFFPFSGNFFLFSESTANFSVSIVRVMRASSTIQKIYHVGVWTSPSHPSVVVWALGWIINLCIHNCIFLLRDWLWLVRVRPWRFDRHMPVRMWICPPRKGDRISIYM